MSMMSLTVSAQLFSYQYKSFVKLEHNSNKVMRNTDTESTTGASLSNSLELYRTTARSESFLKASMLASEYSGEEEKIHSDEDYIFHYGTNYAWSRFTMSLDGDHRRESTYINEIEDAGIKENSKFRITNNVALNATYIPSPKSAISIDLSIKDLAFPDAVPVSLSEYTFVNKSISGVYRLTEKNKIIFTLFETNFDTHTTDTTTDTTGYNVSLQRVFNPLWSGMLMYGKRDSDFKPSCQVGDSCKNKGEMYNITLDREGIKSDFNFSYTKSLTPNTSGNLNQTKEFSLGYTARFSPKLSTQLRYQDYQNKSLTSSVSSRDRKNQTSTIKINYILDTNWYLSGSYVHREQKFPDADDSSKAKSNGVYFLLGYNSNKTGLQL